MTKHDLETRWKRKVDLKKGRVINRRKEGGTEMRHVEIVRPIHNARDTAQDPECPIGRGAELLDNEDQKESIPASRLSSVLLDSF